MQSSRLRPSTTLSAGPGGVFDNLLNLPGMVMEAVEDVQDLLGQSGPSAVSQMEVSTLGMAADGLSKNGLIQTMSLRAAAGSEKKLARQVAKVVAAAKDCPGVLTATADQNQQDPRDFVVFMRYRSMDDMLFHQAQPGFKDLMEQMESQLEKPIGLFLMEERSGQLGMARHPFGPGGEGGRDDAIYSSRRN